MDSGNTSKKKVTLVGFGPKFDGKTIPKRENTDPSITIKLNGINLSPTSDETKCAQNEKVKLVGFARQQSVGPGDNAANVNGTAQRKAKFKSEREERYSRLADDSRDFFSRMNGPSRGNASGSSRPRFEDTFGEGSEHMKKFFDEARQKFDQCSNELFDKFVQENRERFAQMLDTNARMRGSDASENSSWSRHEKSESFSSEQTSSTAGSRSASENGFHARTPSTATTDSSGSSTFKTTSSFVPEPPFESAFPKADPFSKFARPEFPLGSRQFMSFPTFPTFMPFTASPTPSPGHSPRLGRGAYQMSSSKSTFEYCGNTNTYKFCTEQMSQSYEQSYDGISESDDDEDEDVLSTCAEASELDDVSLDLRIQSPGRPLALTYDEKLEKTRNTLQKIATELLTTERTYVGILHIIDQIFQFRVDNENRAHQMFPQEMITQMFSNIKSIYKLHHDFLLPQLEQRISDWPKDPRIGDIMKNFAPFLKMYTEYVRNFDNAMNMINFWYLKNSKFHTIMEEIHRMPECGNLTLQHHMLGPVQRVPRYELLLRDYLKKLPDNSPDQADTEKALHLVSTAANHSNDAMKKIDKFKKLLEIQDLIGHSIDLVSPTRELVREGKIIKISARSGDHQERYLFLFNDLLLLCSQKLISNRVVSGPSYRVRAKLDVDNLQVLEGDNLETANTFYIRNNQKTIEIYTQTQDDKDKWMQSFFKAIQDLQKRKSSLKIGAEPTLVKKGDIGYREPTFLKMDSINNCMSCDSQFSAFKRRHNCRACGKIVCHKCSSHKFPLPYDENKPNRVCNSCFVILAAKMSPEKVCYDTTCRCEVESPIESKGILEVKANDDCVVNGFLLLKTRGKTWVRRWFALHNDFVLYSFRGSEDEKAMTSTPVPGFSVAVPDKSDGVTDRENVFKLFHKKKNYLFQAQDKVDMIRWISALEKASRADLSS